MYAIIIDNLLQVVVPLAFLAIWALTSLLNREAQPLPPRMGRPQPPGGPGPGPGPGGFGTGTGTGSGSAGSGGARLEGLNRDLAGRWGPAPGADRPTTTLPTYRPGGRGDEEILIIEEPRRPVRSASSATVATAPAMASRTGTGTGNPGGARRVSRSRPAGSAPAKRSEPASSRALGGALTTPMPLDQPMSRTIDLSPLSMPHSPLVGTDPRTMARTGAEPARPPGLALGPAPASAFASGPAPWVQGGAGVPILVNTAARLRESIVISEILQPPLALRRRRPFV
jgi:hypothetical protein